MTTDILIPRGLPEPLPAGETLLWQGAPAWRPLAVGAFHVRAVAIYFAALAVWRVATSTADGQSVAETLAAALPLLGLGAAAIAVLMVIALLIARTTVYTITSRRIVLHIGVALPVTFNIPFRIVGAAALARHKDGSGDISLTLTGSDRIAYLLLWPHARPWRFAKSEPTLRRVAEADKVAEILARAAAAATASPVQAKPADADSRAAEGATWPGATAAA